MINEPKTNSTLVFLTLSDMALSTRKRVAVFPAVIGQKERERAMMACKLINFQLAAVPLAGSDFIGQAC